MCLREKTEIRQHIRAERRNVTPAQHHRWSATICEQLLAHPAVRRAATIYAYHPLPDEPDIWPLILQLHRQGKTILLPHILSDTQMTFLPYTGEDQLKEGPYHIMQPSSPLSPTRTGEAGTDSCSCFLIPGMAFTADGKRLGRGKGYYDRYLAHARLSPHTTHLIGICYPYQIINHIPTDKYDIPMNEVLVP